MTNRLLQRKQMVSFLMLCHHLCSLPCQAKMFTKCFNVFIGCWCPPSWQGHSPKDWNQGEACQDVQNHPRCCICLWLQDSVRRWQDNRLCYGLRLFRLCQEEWAQTQTCQGECGTFFFLYHWGSWKIKLLFGVRLAQLLIYGLLMLPCLLFSRIIMQFCACMQFHRKLFAGSNKMTFWWVSFMLSMLEGVLFLKNASLACLLINVSILIHLFLQLYFSN